MHIPPTTNRRTPAYLSAVFTLGIGPSVSPAHSKLPQVMRVATRTWADRHAMDLEDMYLRRQVAMLSSEKRRRMSRLLKRKGRPGMQAARSVAMTP